MTTGISSMAGSSGTSDGTVLGTQSSKFSDNAFLKLLTEQLKSQTPLDPVDNQSFMTQMASYSSMEQQQQLNTNMLKLLDYQGALARVQGLSEGSSLLGKTITYNTDDGHSATGTVQSVYIDDQGNVKARLADGTDVNTRQITGIANPPQA